MPALDDALSTQIFCCYHIINSVGIVLHFAVCSSPVLRSLQVSHSVVMGHGSGASSGDVVDVKEQRTRSAESSGEHWWKMSWWKMLTQRHPPSPVSVTAADVMKTSSDAAEAPSVKASDATFFWRM